MTKEISPKMIFLLAIASGILAANIYYAQTLAGPIGTALGLSPDSIGLIITITQLGYGAGLLLLVPLGDLFENRKLTIILTMVAALGLIGASFSTQSFPFFIASLFIGLGTCAVQILVPLAAHMASDSIRGQVVGKVMSGLMLGIMLARPVSSFITQISSWHTIFLLSGIIMILLCIFLYKNLPQRCPNTQLGYGELLGTMFKLALSQPLLQRRSIYHACLFGAFSLFWTTVPLYLADAYHLTQGGIALFALAGVAGAIAAPIAGRWGDQGWVKGGTALAMVICMFAFLITKLGNVGSSFTLAILVAAAIILDFGVAANMTLSQRVIFGLNPMLRGRLNAIYMTTFFMGGAIGSALGGWAYATGKWPLASSIGLALPTIAFILFTTERQSLMDKIQD